MKRLFLVTALTLAATVTLTAEKSDDSRSKKEANKDSAAAEAPLEATYVHFSIAEQQAVRAYYAPRYRSLPPGLRKKITRGEQLPEGWQRKIEAFPLEIEWRLAPLPSDCARGVIDGHAVIYRTRSERVIDVAALF
jgi:hypothetical protein